MSHTHKPCIQTIAKGRGIFCWYCTQISKISINKRKKKRTVLNSGENKTLLHTWLINSVKGVTIILHILQRCSLFFKCLAFWLITLITESVKDSGEVGPERTQLTSVSKLRKNLIKTFEQWINLFVKINLRKSQK